MTVSRWWRVLRRLVVLVALVVICSVVAAGAGYVLFVADNLGEVSPAAHSTGHDAEWLGHAWVDGRNGKAQVDALAAQIRTTGIHDLFVHSGPFRDDGTLDPVLHDHARWLTDALHAALPGIRVQAWLGAHTTTKHLQLDSPVTRANLLVAMRQVLSDGFDGVHLDFEPVDDGDRDLPVLLHAAHALTKQLHAVLSVSAIHTAPAPGVAAMLNLLPGRLVAWSTGYLRTIALQVDQVALMAYDTGLVTQETYAGYVRRVTGSALGAVPNNVALLIGVPAYHDRRLSHHQFAETVAAAVRGVRLAIGAHPPRRDFGIAMYVDFAATPSDWASYRSDWSNVAGAR